MTARRPAVFLDRDGVLNQDRGYVHRREQFIWIPGAQTAIKLLNDRGFYVFVVTNQAGVAHGYYKETDVHALHEWVQSELQEAGAKIDGWRHCIFHPEAGIEKFRKAHDWRKPKPGMILDLMTHWPVDPARSFLIGDKDTDIEAASAAGIAGHLFPGGNLLYFTQTLLDGDGQSSRP
jgi:D-glycero-D-manno-heptose 1,7-bisphosphate phosphatase